MLGIWYLAALAIGVGLGALAAIVFRVVVPAGTTGKYWNDVAMRGTGFDAWGRRAVLEELLRSHSALVRVHRQTARSHWQLPHCP